MAELEEETLSEIEFKPYMWWRYVGNIFFLWEHGEESFKEFIERLNQNNSTLKCDLIRVSTLVVTMMVIFIFIFVFQSV